MNKPIGKIERQNHLNHLTKIVPFIAIIFGVQCFMIYKMTGGQIIGDYAMILGVSLAVMIGMMIYYDNNHHVILFDNHIRVIFELTGTDQEIFYDDIEEIITGTQDATFSTMTIVQKDGTRNNLYFVDYPFYVKKLIEELSNKKKQNDFAA
jgi:hypothetical protein